MAVASCSSSGQPSLRYVLLKGAREPPCVIAPLGCIATLARRQHPQLAAALPLHSVLRRL